VSLQKQHLTAARRVLEGHHAVHVNTAWEQHCWVIHKKRLLSAAPRGCSIRSHWTWLLGESTSDSRIKQKWPAERARVASSFGVHCFSSEMLEPTFLVVSTLASTSSQLRNAVGTKARARRASGGVYNSLSSGSRSSGNLLRLFHFRSSSGVTRSRLVGLESRRRYTGTRCKTVREFLKWLSTRRQLTSLSLSPWTYHFFHCYKWVRQCTLL